MRRAAVLLRRRFCRSHLEAAAQQLHAELGETFQRMRRVADLHAQISATEEQLERRTAELLLSGKPTVFELVEDYFAARTQFGACETLLAKTLDLLRRFYAFRGDYAPSKDDLSRDELLLSGPFASMLEDVKTLLSAEGELRGDVLAHILQSLTALGLKSRGLIELAVARALRELRKTSRGDSLFPAALSAELQILFNLRQPRPQPPSGDELEQFSQTAAEAGRLSAQFLQMVSALRQNYFALKGGARRQFLAENPAQLLDFLLLEEQLVALGVVMPYDLVAEENTARANELAAQQIAVTLGLNPSLTTRLAEQETAEQPALKVEELERRRQTFAEESALLLLGSALEMLTAPLPSAPAADDLSDTRMAGLFAPVTTQFEEKSLPGASFHQRKIKETYELQSRPLPAFYYGYAFKTVRRLLQTQLEAWEPSLLSPLSQLVLSGCLRLFELDARAFEEKFAVTERLSLVGVEGFKAVVLLCPFLRFDLFAKFVRSAGIESHLQAAADAWEKAGAPLNYRAALLYFAEAASLSAKEGADAAAPLVRAATAPGALEAFGALYRKQVSPFDRSLASAWVFLYRRRGEMPAVELERVDAALRIVLNVQGEAGRNHDPVRYFLRNSLRKEVDGIEWTDELQAKDDLVESWLPDLILEGAKRPRAVHLCPPGLSADSVDTHLRQSLLPEAEAVVLPLNAFMADKEFFLSFDFRLQEDGQKLRAVLQRLLPAAAAEEELSQAMEGVIAAVEPEAREALEGVGRLLRGASNDGGFLHAVAQRLSELKPEHATLNKFVLLCRERASVVYAEQPVFWGRRFGKELLSRRVALSDLANADLLGQTAYLLFDSSAAQSSRLSALEWKRLEGSVAGRFGRVEKALLPDPRGRFQYRIDDFALFWDQPLAADIEGLVHRPAAAPGFHFALLNLLYSFRLLSDFEGFFSELFSLPMWGKVAALALGELSDLRSSPATLSPSQRLSAPAFHYKTSFVAFKGISDEVEHLKRMSQEVLPQLLAESITEEERVQLIQAVESAKNQYLRSLEKYKKALVDHSSSYVGEDYKDLVTRIKSGPEQTDMSQATVPAALPSEQLIYALLFSKAISAQPLSPFEQILQKALSKTGNFSTLRLFPKGVEVALETVMRETDFAFFARHFPSAELSVFASASFSDLATALALTLNADLLADFRSGAFLRWSQPLPPGTQPHHLRLDLLEVERTAEREARRLSPSDVEQLLRLFAVNRS